MPLLSLTLDRPTCHILDTLTGQLNSSREVVIAQALYEYYDKLKAEKRLQNLDDGQAYELSQQEYARLKAEQ